MLHLQPSRGTEAFGAQPEVELSGAGCPQHCRAKYSFLRDEGVMNTNQAILAIALLGSAVTPFAFAQELGRVHFETS